MNTGSTPVTGLIVLGSVDHLPDVGKILDTSQASFNLEVNMIKAIETHYNGYRFRSRLEARWAVFFDTLGIKYRYELDGFNLDGTWYLPDFWLPEQDCWIEIKGAEPTKEEIEKAELLAIYQQKPVYIFYGDAWIPNEDDKSAYACKDYFVSGECGRDFEHMRRAWKAQELGLNLYDDHEETEEYKDLQLSCEIPDVSPHIMALFYELNKHHMSLLSVQHSRESYEKRHIHLEFPINVSPAILTSTHKKIQKYEEDLLALLSYQPNFRWEVSKDIHFGHWWCECPICHKYGIAEEGHSYCLPCKCLSKAGIDISIERQKYQTDKTPRLIAAYTAARQARFEHGEKG